MRPQHADRIDQPFRGTVPTATCAEPRGVPAMNLLSSPWWTLPLILFAVPVGATLAYNRFYRHKAGVNQHLVLSLFVGACWLSAIILILQRVQ